MKPVDLQRPFRLTSEFWVAYALLAFPTTWLSHPWYWDLPLYSQIAGMLVFPFIATIACYCPVVFVITLLRGSPTDKYIGRAALYALAGSSAFLIVLWYTRDFGPMPSTAAVPAVGVALIILGWMNARRQR